MSEKIKAENQNPTVISPGDPREIAERMFYRALLSVEELNPGFKFKFCKKCHGQGHIGYLPTPRVMSVCKCVRKQIKENKLKLEADTTKEESSPAEKTEKTA